MTFRFTVVSATAAGAVPVFYTFERPTPDLMLFQFDGPVLSGSPLTVVLDSGIRLDRLMQLDQPWQRFVHLLHELLPGMSGLVFGPRGLTFMAAHDEVPVIIAAMRHALELAGLPSVHFVCEGETTTGSGQI